MAIFRKNKKNDLIVPEVKEVRKFDKSYREIVDGKMYDTVKATYIYSYSKQTESGWMCWEDKDVYVTEKGNFFEVSKLSYGYTKVVVLEEDKVRKHLGCYDVEKYIKYFGEPEEA